MHISEYDFDVMKVIKEGFRRIEGIKQPFLIAFAIYLAVAIVVQMLLGLVFPSDPENPNIVNQQIVAILSYPVLIPLLTGIMMMAVKQGRGNKDALDVKSIFEYYPLAGKLSFASLLIYLLTMFLPMMIMLFPGVLLAGAGENAVPVLMIIAMFVLLFVVMYLSIAYIFTLPLIADKGLGVWEAMELSRKTVAKRWGKVALVVTILSLAAVVGVLTFGIGLIWAIPLFFVTLYGLLYVMIFDDVEEM